MSNSSRGTRSQGLTSNTSEIEKLPRVCILVTQTMLGEEDRALAPASHLSLISCETLSNFTDPSQASLSPFVRGRGWVLWSPKASSGSFHGSVKAVLLGRAIWIHWSQFLFPSACPVSSTKNCPRGFISLPDHPLVYEESKPDFQFLFFTTQRVW